MCAPALRPAIYTHLHGPLASPPLTFAVGPLSAPRTAVRGPALHVALASRCLAGVVRPGSAECVREPLVSARRRQRQVHGLTVIVGGALYDPGRHVVLVCNELDGKPVVVPQSFQERPLSTGVLVRADSPSTCHSSPLPAVTRVTDIALCRNANGQKNRPAQKDGPLDRFLDGRRGRPGPVRGGAARVALRPPDPHPARSGAPRQLSRHWVTPDRLVRAPRSLTLPRGQRLSQRCRSGTAGDKGHRGDEHRAFRLRVPENGLRTDSAVLRYRVQGLPVVGHEVSGYGVGCFLQCGHVGHLHARVYALVLLPAPGPGSVRGPRRRGGAPACV